MKVKSKINNKHLLSVKYAVCIVIEKDNKLLLLRRFNTGWKNGYYNFPAGHVEDNESYKQAAVRELKEEANLSTRESYLKLIHIVDVSPTKTSPRYMYIFFKCDKWSGIVKNNEPDKCDDIRWFDVNKLPLKFSPVNAHAWKYIKKGLIHSELGWKSK